MSFYEAMTEAFFIRFEDVRELDTLKRSADYQERMQAFDVALEAIGNSKTAQEVRQAVIELGDIVTQFYYRVGLKDGVSMTASDFTTPCIA